MKTLFSFCFRWSWPCFLIIVGLTLGFSTFVADTRIEVSNDSLMGRKPALLSEYERIRQQFGSDQIVAVYARDPELFSPEKLHELAELQRVFSRLPHVQRVDSLFTVSTVARTEDGVELGPLFHPHAIPDDPNILEERKQRGLRNPLIAGRLLSADGEATLFTLFMDSPAQGDGRTQSAFQREVYHLVEYALETHRPGFAALYQVGAPAIQDTISHFIIEDQKLLLPIAALVLLILIGVLLRSMLAALIPLLNTLVATIWILAFMVWMGIPVTILNSIIPALLLIIGATEDVHFFTEYKHARRSGKNPLEAVQSVGNHIGLTLLLTGITTSIGFAATAATNLPILREFGLTAGLAIALRMLLTFTLLPATLGMFRSAGRTRPKSVDKKHERKPFATEAYCRLIIHGVLHRPKLVISLLFGVALVGVYFAQRVEVRNDLIGFLDPDSSMVRQIEETGRDLAGTKVLFLTLEGTPGQFRSPEALRQVARIQQRLSVGGRLDSTTSMADFIALLHREFSGNTSDELHIPENEALIAQYLLMLSPDALRPYVNADYSSANIVLRTNLHDSREFSALYRQIRYRLASGEFGRLSFSLTGQSILISEAVDEIVRGQALSIAVVIGILFVIVAFLFVSGKASFLAVLSNLFPVAVLFGTMGLLGIPLNVGTCMVAAITIGIAVDDTLHLMVRYNRQLKTTKNERKALEASLRAEFLPVSVTSLALAAGFAVLLFSNFIPVRQFAGLSAMVIFLAVISDLLLTPVLLSTTRLITLWDILGLRLRRALIEQSPLFKGMRPWQAKKIILSANLETYDQGAYVVRQNDVGETMYVIIEGDLEVRRGPADQKSVLARLSTGDTFGEIALVARSRRTADVVAVRPTRLLALDWETLNNLQRFAPYLTSRLFLNLSRILGERMISSLGKLDTTTPFSPKKDSP